MPQAAALQNPPASHNWHGIFFLLVSLCASLALRAADVTDDIKAVLITQQAAWNRGDIDGFMAGYVQSDDLRFASGGTVTYGWKTTLERYKKHYPDKATMGTLAFRDLVVTVLAPDAALVFGKWELTRDRDKPWGLFTLTLKKTPAGWRVFQDHTSSSTEK